MSSKIRIKMGPIEVECEGTEAFLKDELPDLLSTVSNLYKESKIGVGDNGGDDPGGGTGGPGQAGVGKIEGTTGTIAAKLQAKSGSDLILAACAHLTFVAKQKTSTRQQIIDQMKSATGYYKKSHSNNLSKNLLGLVQGGKLIEPSSGSYALNAPTRTDLEIRLA